MLNETTDRIVIEKALTRRAKEKTAWSLRNESIFVIEKEVGLVAVGQVWSHREDHNGRVVVTTVGTIDGDTVVHAIPMSEYIIPSYHFGEGLSGANMTTQDRMSARLRSALTSPWKARVGDTGIFLRKDHFYVSTITSLDRTQGSIYAEGVGVPSISHYNDGLVAVVPRSI